MRACMTVSLKIRCAKAAGLRHNVFASNSRWVYFCEQCRRQFETAFPKNKVAGLQHRIEALEKEQKALRNKLKAMRAAAH